MNLSPLVPEVILWTDPQRMALTQRIITAMGDHIRLIGLASPRGSDTAALAQAHDLKPGDDLRQLIVDHPASYMLLATTDPVDLKLLQLAMSQGTTILSLEPWLSAFDQVISLKAPSGQGRLMSLPAFTASQVWVKAGHTQDLLGHIRMIAFESIGPWAELSLHARLAEAWQVVSRFGAQADSIDCALTGPLPQIPEDPRGMTGYLTAHARLQTGCAAQVTLCDQTDGHQRRLLVVGDDGRLIMTDLAYQLYDKQGQLLEQADLQQPIQERYPQADRFVQLAADQWQRLIQLPDQDWITSSEQDQTHHLSCQLASLLSARTGQSEHPSQMATMRR